MATAEVSRDGRWQVRGRGPGTRQTDLPYIEPDDVDYFRIDKQQTAVPAKSVIA